MARSSPHFTFTFSQLWRSRYAVISAATIALLFLSSSSSALIDLTIFGPKRYDRLKGKPTVYTDSFEHCSSAGQAILKVTNGDSKKTRVKSARIYLNGVRVASESDFKQRIPSFEKAVSLSEKNQLTVILKSGHHGYLKNLEAYEETKSKLALELTAFRNLRNELTASGSSISVEELAAFLQQFRDIKKSSGSRHRHLQGITRGLDDDFEDTDAGPSSDDEPEIDSGWARAHRAELETTHRALKDALRDCKNARDAHNRGSSRNRGSDHYEKKRAFEELCSLLQELDHIIAGLIHDIEDIEDKIEKYKWRGPSFIIIEVVGKNCDNTPPIIFNPEPTDESVSNSAIPRIAARYADEDKGTGIDTASVRMFVEGTDVTASASVTPSGISYTPAVSLVDGLHMVTVSVSDLTHNPASLSWSFTTDTIAPSIHITSHQNGQYTKTPAITVSGTIDDPNASVTINGQPAQVNGNTFTLANFVLSEGAKTIIAEAKDAATNIGTDQITVTLDTVLPVVAVTAPTPDSFLNTPTITVTGTVTELHPAGFWINDQPAALTGENFSFPVTLGLEGSNTIIIRAVDSANNERTIVVPVTLDRTPPVVTISAPQNNAIFNSQPITVSGTVNEPVTSVMVNNIPAQVTDLSFTVPAFTLTEEGNTITVTAIDRAGNPGPAQVSVTLDTIKPLPPVITQPTSPTKTAQLNLSGSAEAGSSVKVYYTAPGSTEPSLLGTYPADAQGQFTVPMVTLAEGTNTFTATATDSATNTSDSSSPIEIVFDIKPPAITVTAPASGTTYTNQAEITVSGTVDEPATVTINDTSVVLDNLSFQHTMTLQPGPNPIVIAATDTAGNPSTPDTRIVNLDQVNPIVSISTPSDGLLTNIPQVTVTGSVSETVTSVLVNNTPAQVSGNMFTVQLTLVENENTITVQATDRASNIGSASVNVTLDTQVPIVSVNAPAEAAAGMNITISASASDTRGLSSHDITVNGMTIWSKALNSELSTSNSVQYSISPDTATGTILTIQSRAYDRVGNLGPATAQVVITEGASGPGFIKGEVYDDSKGLRLEDASVSILSLSSTPHASPLTPYVTTEDGGYFTEAAQGAYLVALSKSGFTSVERPVAVRSEINSVAIDARLTPISAQQNLIDANGGTIGSSSMGQGASVELEIPAGAMTEQVDIRLTPISNQGLAGLLPAGWSPIAVVDIVALPFTGNGSSSGINPDATFGQAATLKIPVFSAFGLSASSEVTLVKYDSASHSWIVQNAGVVSSDAAFITAPINSTGQYAFVLPDSTVSPVPGSVLSPDPGPVTLDPAAVSAAGRVVPPAAPAKTGLKAIGEVILTPSASPLPPDGFLSSGVIVNGKVTERFELMSGDVNLPQDYIQDLVLYRYPCITNQEPSIQGQGSSSTVQTTFPVSPSHEYTIIDLMKGKVGIEITRSLTVDQGTGTMVGTTGARLLDQDGDVLVIPENALTRTVPVETKGVPAATLTGIVGSDFTLIKAVEVNLSNQVLTASAELSIPAVSGLNPALPLVIAKAIDVNGVKKLKLVALARLSGSLITSSLTGLNCSNCLNGITSTGTYLFLQAKAPVGFITGIVKDAASNPYASALVTSTTCSLVDVSGIGGKYLIAGTVSGFTATAIDYSNNTGSATGTISTANQVLTADLAILITRPKVVSAGPGLVNSKGAAELNTTIVVRFSEPVNRATLTTTANDVTVNNITVKETSGPDVKGAYSVNPDSNIVTFYPESNLKSETGYSITISTDIKDLQGYSLASAFTSSFTTRDVTPPAAGGVITASFPDAEGWVTITGTQGSAEYTGTVLIINDTTGQIVSVYPAENGSFTGKIMAQAGDEIKIVSMDDTGNQTLISYVTFKNDQGEYMVTAKGGTVEGPDGIRLDIPEGALMGPTVVKITPVLEEQLPVDNPVPAQAEFLAAVNIDTNGIPFNKEITISVPTPSDVPPDAVPFIVQPMVHTNADGTQENVHVIRDSAKIINGRLTTACEPFDGIVEFGMFVFEYMKAPLDAPVIVSGFTYRDMDGISGYAPSESEVPNPSADQPIKGAVIRCPAALNFISYSNLKGKYATYTFTTPGVCREVSVTAINPQTMFSHTAPLMSCGPYVVNNFNFKLADKDTQIPDKTPPVIEMNFQIVPGQENDPRFLAGTVPVGTNIEIKPLNIIDQQMGQASLTVTYAGSGVTSSPSATLSQSETTIHAYITPDNPVAIYKYVYQPGFGSPVGGSQSNYFRPNAPGTYTLKIDATDAAGNMSARTMTVRATEPGPQPEGIDGPPVVDEIIPSDGAKEIMVTMPVMITFNEPVQNVTENTIKLLDHSAGDVPVPVTISTSLEGGRMKVTLQPKSNLIFAHDYKIAVTQDIIDAVPNASSPPENPYLNLDMEYSATFKTKVPTVYDLASEQQIDDGRDIVLYTSDDGHTYAYLAAGSSGRYTIDVTDPTKPTMTQSENMTNSGVTWIYRNVAVDPEQSLLAFTEDIRYADGNQYGYIRFYDLTSDETSGPSAPRRIVGREKLAEAFSGIPGKIALLGKYAYVLNINAGLQIVDIEAAKTYMSSGKQADGSSIVGGFSTVELSCSDPDNPNTTWCGNASDIAVYKNNSFTTALLSTFSGHLVELDLSMPQIPVLITAFKPSGYSAWRIAVAPDYSYLDADSVSQVMDIAVTSSKEGKIHTLDLTDPYSIKKIGVVKDELGNERTDLSCSDIKISKASGLAYATGFTSVYVIDIKDPYNPKLLNIISQVPDSSGVLGWLGSSMALAEKDGWVYLANQQRGMRILDLDPVFIGIEQKDKDDNLSKVMLKPQDYYPVLGTRALRIWGNVNGAALNNEWELCLKETVPNFDIGLGLNASNGKPSNLLQANSCGGSFTPESDGKGYMTVYLRWNGWDNLTSSQTPSMPEPFDLKIYAKKKNVMVLVTADPTANASEVCKTCRIAIRHNGNVDLSEVMAGTAIFAADGMQSVSEKGKQRFDFVKEMLNQVVPRKGTLKFDTIASPLKETEEKNYPYNKDNIATPLLDAADGLFEKTADNPKSKTSQALEIFRRSFNMGNTSTGNASNTFNKLMKDYNKTEAEKPSYLYQVVDKETLVGTQNKIYGVDSSPDYNIGQETGLYELYKNVVERFVNALIEEAEHFSGDAPKDNWYSRDNYGPKDCKTATEPSKKCKAEHGKGMSYSYDGKMSISQFNNFTSEICRVESEDRTLAFTSKSPLFGLYLPKAAMPDSTQSPVVPMHYEGNLNNLCSPVPGSNLKYPGLKEHEYNARKVQYVYTPYSSFPKATTVLAQYKGEYWAGIDCSGLVQRSINYADSIGVPGAKSKVPRLQDDRSGAAWSQDLVVNCSQCVSNYTYRIAYDPQNAEPTLSKIRKGDLVGYRHHISIVHSERPSCEQMTNAAGEDVTTCTYEIVHAYGNDTYAKTDPITKKKGKPQFSRKVMVTGNDITAVPTGFGRIKLWD